MCLVLFVPAEVSSETVMISRVLLATNDPGLNVHLQGLLRYSTTCISYALFDVVYGANDLHR